MNESRKPIYLPLKKLEDFWDKDRLEPNGVQDLFDFEDEKQFKVPMLLKNIYSISNGGTTNYGYLKFEDRYYGVFPEAIPPISDWELFKDYVSGYDIDDEDTLEFLESARDAYICYRHGFEYFLLFWNSPDPEVSQIGLLDLAAPVGDPGRFTRWELSSDPTQVFHRHDYGRG